MDIDFDDVLEAELPFIRTNPNEVEVIELDGTGNVLDVVATNPCYLNALESDYYLEPIIDDTTDEMRFEMSELYPDELGALFKIGGTIGAKVGTGGVTGRASTRTSTTSRTGTSTRKPFSTSVKKPFSTSIISSALAKRQALIQKAISAAKAKVKPTVVSAPISAPKSPWAKSASWSGIKLAQCVTMPGTIAVKPSAVLPRSIFKEIHAAPPSVPTPRPPSVPVPRPQIVATPKLATAGVTCGCAQIGRIETMLKTAANQRLATSEHSDLINQSMFRRKTLSELKAILGRLSSSDRSKVIRAACGMGR